MNFKLMEMISTGVRLARGRTNMWDAWLGFNLSHRLGAILLGAACISIGIFLHSLHLPGPTLLIPVTFESIYFLLAIHS